MRRGLLALLLAASAAAVADDGLVGSPAPGHVRGRVMGKDGALLGVDVLVLVDGREVAACRTDSHGRYRVEAPAGEVELEAKPGPWTKLDPIRRRIAVEGGTECVEDFVLGGIAGASGFVRGAGVAASLKLVAIPVDGSAARVATEARGAFTFAGLEPGIEYRVAVEGYGWGLERPVLLRAGDTGVTLRVERVLQFVVEARDIGAAAPLSVFRVKVLDPDGQIRHELETRNGRLAYREPHPDSREPPERFAARLRAAAPPWRIVVEADGYFPATGTLSEEQTLFLQRERAPNVLLLVKDRDAVPIDGDVAGMFEAADAAAGAADARVSLGYAGLYRAVLPPGSWRLTLSHKGEAVQVRIDVPRSGVVTVQPPPLPRR